MFILWFKRIAQQGGNAIGGGCVCVCFVLVFFAILAYNTEDLSECI